MLFIGLLGALSLPNAFAEREKAGNGGGTFVCLDERNVVLSAQSQELWTIRDEKGEVDSFAGSYSEIADRAIERIGAVNLRLLELVRAEKAAILAKMQIRKVRIAYLRDDRHVWENTDCVVGRPEFMPGAVSLDETGEVIFSESIWGKLPEIDRAALLTHEAVYKALRVRYGDTDSERAQGIVRAIYAKSAKAKDRAAIPEFCVKTEAKGCFVRVGVEQDPPFGVFEDVFGAFYQAERTRRNGKTFIKDLKHSIGADELIPLGKNDSPDYYRSIRTGIRVLLQSTMEVSYRVRVAGEIVVDVRGKGYFSRPIGKWGDPRGSFDLTALERYIP